MTAPAGWYPDPAGGRDLYRYWDGSGWSEVTSPHPGAPPPSRTPPPATAAAPRRRSSAGWIVAGLAVVVAIVLIGVLVVRQVAGGGAFGDGGGGQPSNDNCPSGAEESVTAAPRPDDGRVHGGRLSYPRLGGGWGLPNLDRRVPFGKDVQHQFATIETGRFLGFTAWGADVMVGELVAGDGFFAPKDGVGIVVRCVTGTFYGDTAVTRDDRRSEAITVDGHTGWIAETNLGFNVPNLKAKHELLIVVVVDIGDGTAGLFLASIPENGPQYVPQARQALAQLRVDD